MRLCIRLFLESQSPEDGNIVRREPLNRNGGGNQVAVKHHLVDCNQPGVGKDYLRRFPEQRLLLPRLHHLELPIRRFQERLPGLRVRAEHVTLAYPLQIIRLRSTSRRDTSKGRIFVPQRT